MKRVAVFGNTGGGKSTLARRLAELTRLPLYPLDLIQFRAGGAEVPRDDYLKAHGTKSSWERFARADTLVYVDLPLFTHFLWVTKRFLKSLLVAPEGWPQGSPMLASTLNSYRVISAREVRAFLIRLARGWRARDRGR